MPSCRLCALPDALNTRPGLRLEQHRGEHVHEDDVLRAGEREARGSGARLEHDGGARWLGLEDLDRPPRRQPLAPLLGPPLAAAALLERDGADAALPQQRPDQRDRLGEPRKDHRLLARGNHVLLKQLCQSQQLAAPAEHLPATALAATDTSVRAGVGQRLDACVACAVPLHAPQQLGPRLLLAQLAPKTAGLQLWPRRLPCGVELRHQRVAVGAPLPPRSETAHVDAVHDPPSKEGVLLLGAQRLTLAQQAVQQVRGEGGGPKVDWEGADALIGHQPPLGNQPHLLALAEEVAEVRAEAEHVLSDEAALARRPRERHDAAIVDHAHLGDALTEPRQRRRV
mmetsp:Transcript_16141/g.51535  ORF Transcript_16141/g.51535 Transcript_16141/m.51535 type:complete len:341 (+) Transcript_16141:275-1297(+)